MKLSNSICFGSLLLAATLAAQPASEVKCGMMVTSNLTLTADLNCPSLAATGAALIVLANGVTINLNGRSVTGTGSGVGIVVVGVDDVSIAGGDVRGFGYGVYVTQGPQNDRSYSPRLSGLRLTHNLVGVSFDGARFGEITDCEVSQNLQYGILLLNATDHTVVSRNLVYDNARGGMVVGCVPASRPTRSCDGMYSTENTVEDNIVISNGRAKGTEMEGNSAIMVAFGDRNSVRKNLVMDNNTAGDAGQLNVTKGILIAGGSDNVVAENRVISNGRGIEVSYYPGTTPAYSTNTVVTRNALLNNASSGILVTSEGAIGTVIADNDAIANGHAETTGFNVQCRSGIRVQTGGTSLMNNRSYDNAAYGFNVETKDLRVQYGNRAERNGADVQCSGLTCE